MEGFVPIVAPSPPVKSIWGLDVRISSIVSIQKFETPEEYVKHSLAYHKRGYDCNFFHETTLDFALGVYEIVMDTEIHGFKCFIVHPVFNRNMEFISVGANEQMYKFFAILKHAPHLMEYAKKAMDNAESGYKQKEKEKRMRRTRE